MCKMPTFGVAHMFNAHISANMHAYTHISCISTYVMHTYIHTYIHTETKKHAEKMRNFGVGNLNDETYLEKLQKAHKLKYVYICACMRVCVCMCECLCVCVYVCICIYLFVCM